MTTGKWFKDSCPYCRDQGFDSVIGDVETGESVFGFTHTQVAAADVIIFVTETATTSKVTNMSDSDYKVFVTKSSSASEASAPVSKWLVSAQKRDRFTLTGEATKIYDVVIRGRILY